MCLCILIHSFKNHYFEEGTKGFYFMDLFLLYGFIVNHCSERESIPAFPTLPEGSIAQKNVWTLTQSASAMTEMHKYSLAWDTDSAADSLCDGTKCFNPMLASYQMFSDCGIWHVF